MDAFEYQTQLRNFIDYPVELGPYYTILGIYDELGKLSEKLRESLKDKDGNFSDRDIQRLEISIGDIIFYLTCMCNDLNININQVLEMNLKKQNLIKQKRTNEALDKQGIKHI